MLQNADVMKALRDLENDVEEIDSYIRDGQLRLARKSFQVMRDRLAALMMAVKRAGY
jgi:hypothetical protein